MMKQQEIKNSEIIRQTIFSLIYVASGKSSNSFACSIVKKLIDELSLNYDFLEYVKIPSSKDSQNNLFDIEVSSDIDSVEPSELGAAIQEIIDIFKMKMGAKAGYTFIKEFKNILGEKYHTKIKKMGVDLRLIDLQNELSDVDGGSYEIRDDQSSNIAYVQKK